jgi:hypothetical protein
MTDVRGGRPLGEEPTDAELIRAAMETIEQDKLEVQARIAAEKRRLPVRFAVYVLVLGLVVSGAWWGLQTNRSQGPPPRTPDRVEAELRYGTYLAAQRIDQFVATVGRLPRSASELGYGEAWIRFEAGDEGTWRLVAREGTIEVVLRSSDDRKGFLGGAVERVVSGK